jgi:tRNA (cmo5U34)-methyltransferase
VVLMIPHPREQEIRVLDLGAGYGALAAAVLADRPNARAVCLDGSEAMIRLGRERNARLGTRMEFVRGPLDSPGWMPLVSGPFDAVISARALHHLTHDERRRLFHDVYGLIRPGGCFINADNFKPGSEELRATYRKTRKRYIDALTGNTAAPESPQRTRLPHGAHYNGLMEDEISRLREAGFRDVDVFWKFTNYAVYGGFKA